jgi:hypothetical protein
MTEVYLTYPTPEGSQEIALNGEKMSFGRGSEADFRFEDDGLSRLHATIYRDGDYIWVVDENSTNGTFVNGEKVSPSGTPLRDGDVIKIGHYTNLKIRISEKSEGVYSAPAVSGSQTATASTSEMNLMSLLPIALFGIAFLVISVSAVFIGITVFGGSNQPEIVEREDFRTPRDSSESRDEKEDKTLTPTPKTEKPVISGSNSDNTTLTDPIEASNNTTTVNLPSGKKYLEMSESEKNQYVEAKALKVARMIGNRSSDSIPTAAVEKIKEYVNGYARRASTKSLGGCRFGDNLQVTYERASKNAPFINRAFNAQGIDPQIGLYLAMIESEHCVCLQSPTGPLGMFQFTQATGRNYGLEIRAGASPTNPDERCQPEPAANAAAKYMKFLTGRFGTGPLSVPLAIGSYNSGEGGLSTNLKTALEANESQERSFWTLIANADKLSKQFKLENVKYVPKFFAAAIIGENPQDFGLSLQPLSTYTK